MEVADQKGRYDIEKQNLRICIKDVLAIVHTTLSSIGTCSKTQFIQQMPQDHLLFRINHAVMYLESARIPCCILSNIDRDNLRGDLPFITLYTGEYGVIRFDIERLKSTLLKSHIKCDNFNMKKFLSKRKKLIIILFLLVFFFSTNLLCFFIKSSYDYNRPTGHEYSSEEVLNFPKDFLWGAATASYQVEGGNIYSNWWEFEQIEGKIKNGDRTDIALDHYNLYEQDFDLIKQLNLNSHRFSIEWSRIENEKGVFNSEEIDHYRKVISALKQRNIEPMITLWHHSLPTWFENEGGWEKRENVKYYEEYVSYIVKNLSDEVDLWLTMNEPMAYISCSYISAKWPSAQQDFSKIYPIFSNLVYAHKGAYEIIHSNDKDAKVGIAEHTSYAVPYHKDNIMENSTSYVIDYLWTHLLLEKVYKELDFIGLHYYYRQFINIDLVKDLIGQSLEDFENQSMDRSYFPQGLFEVLMRLKKYNLPIYITEIGVPDYHEIKRDQFIREHLIEVYYAIQAGIDVKGFYYWALLDSFEWNEGYDAKFGLIAVDLETQERTIKPESWEYAEIAKCNCVTKAKD